MAGVTRPGATPAPPSFDGSGAPNPGAARGSRTGRKVAAPIKR
jgi:hypothetical protein